MPLVLIGHASTASTAAGAREAHSGSHWAGAGMWWPRTKSPEPGLLHAWGEPPAVWSDFFFFINTAKHSRNPHLFHKYSLAGQTHPSLTRLPNAFLCS